MIKKQLYESDSVDLRIREVIPVSFFNRSPKSIVYSIYRHGEYECIGECDLRFGMDEELYYAGIQAIESTMDFVDIIMPIMHVGCYFKSQKKNTIFTM